MAMRTVAVCAAGLLAVAVARPAFADVDPAVVAAIKKIKPADYPSANAVLVRNEQSVVYQDDGQFTNTLHEVKLVLTQAGKAEAASLSLDYTKDAEKIEVVLAQVIKPDGKAVPVPAKDIQDVEQTGDMNIYDPMGRAKKITFASLAVGDAVEVTYKLVRTLPTRPGYFNDIYNLQSTDPMLSTHVVIDGPAGKPLTTEIYHRERTTKVTESRTRTGDRMRYEWSVASVPQLITEPGMTFSTELATLIVTTDPSWQHFSAWWADVAKQKLQVSPEVEAKAKELVKDKKTRDEKIKALYDFVSQDIRYRGLGVGPRTGYTPRSAHETLTSRWGVCRDVSILLTAMLRSQGFDAYPVLTNVGDPVLPKIAYDGFNHAIVAMPRPGGGWTFMDPTAKNNSELLPGTEAEQSSLVATPKGEPLGAIPALDPKANLGRAIATSTLGADGTLRSKVTLETKGMFDMAVRGAAVSMSKDEQKQIVEQVMHEALPDAKVVSYDTTGPLALWVPMKITIELEVPNAATKAGDHQLLRTLVTSGALGLVENVLPRLLGAAPTRKYMLDAHLTFQYEQEETVALPAGTQIVALPNPAHAANKITELDARCTQQGATQLICKRSFALKSRFVAPAQYAELRSSVAQLGRIARQPVILAGGK